MPIISFVGREAFPDEMFGSAIIRRNFSYQHFVGKGLPTYRVEFDVS
ncbi:MAG: hypothetical protein RQ936_06940 [Gammaproteobacteria bacterium]|nr:hypothetical protein [Gammaproteobacteria bacterium]